MIFDIASGLKIIKDRNIGLQHFVDSFRSISKLPEPNFVKLNIQSLFSGIELFWKEEFEKKNVKCESFIDDSVEYVVADKNQIEQIIINLIKNSLEANGSKISISAFEDSYGKVSIKISDNGKGIHPEIIDEIFMPFFTTKEQGSGIGLSLARQIIRLHGGSISVQSVPNSETSFTLSF
jgi:signal transduction histidine kinase